MGVNRLDLWNCVGGRAGEELEGQSLETRGQNSPRPPGYFDTETDWDFQVLAGLWPAAGHPGRVWGWEQEVK